MSAIDSLHQVRTVLYKAGFQVKTKTFKIKNIYLLLNMTQSSQIGNEFGIKLRMFDV